MIYWFATEWFNGNRTVWSATQEKVIGVPRSLEKLENPSRSLGGCEPSAQLMIWAQPALAMPAAARLSRRATRTWGDHHRLDGPPPVVKVSRGTMQLPWLGIEKRPIRGYAAAQNNLGLTYATDNACGKS
jgi:hypothetical protein